MHFSSEVEITAQQIDYCFEIDNRLFDFTSSRYNSIRFDAEKYRPIPYRYDSLT